VWRRSVTRERPAAKVDGCMKRVILTGFALCFAHAANAQVPFTIAVLGVDDLGNGTRTTRTWLDRNHNVMMWPWSSTSVQVGQRASPSHLDQSGAAAVFAEGERASSFLQSRHTGSEAS
jgi:hypothetical protein